MGSGDTGIRYVKTTGSDSNDGKSWANAWKTVTYGMTNVPTNGTLIIGYGDYTSIEPTGSKPLPIKNCSVFIENSNGTGSQSGGQVIVPVK